METSPHARLWFFVLVVGAAYTIPHGYQIAVVNEPEQILREWVNHTTDYQYSKQRIVELWSFIVTCRMLGSIIGNLIVPVMMEMFGRKKTLMFMSVFLVVGDMLCVCSYYANAFWMMVVGRVLTGMTTGGCLNVFTVYTTEIAPAHLRGRISIIGMMFRSAGMILAAISGLSYTLGTATSWPMLFLIPAIICLMGPPCLLFCPESPRWLYITKGDTEGALKSLRFYNGPDMDITKTEMELKQASEQYSHRLRFRDVFKNPVFRKPLLLGILFGCVFAFGGRAVVMHFSTMLISTANIPMQYAQYVTLVAYILPLPITFIMLPLVDRYGRKPLLTVICSLTILLELVLCIAFMMMEHGSGKNDSVWGWVVIVAVSIWIPTVVGGLMSFQFIPSEIFPQNARSAGNAVHIITTFGMGAVTTQTFQPLENISRGYGLVFMLVPMIVCTLVMLWFLPETKNVSLEAAATGSANKRGVGTLDTIETSDSDTFEPHDEDNFSHSSLLNSQKFLTSNNRSGSVGSGVRRYIRQSHNDERDSQTLLTPTNRIRNYSTLK